MSGMTVVEVEALPWPWNPFRCAFFREFEAAVAQLPEEVQDEDGERGRVFADLVTRLGEERRHRCPYHRADWRLAAELAVSLWKLSIDDKHSDFVPALERGGAGQAEVDAA
jgi:hypothetical protein